MSDPRHCLCTGPSVCEILKTSNRKNLTNLFCLKSQLYLKLDSELLTLVIRRLSPNVTPLPATLCLLLLGQKTAVFYEESGVYNR